MAIFTIFSNFRSIQREWLLSYFERSLQILTIWSKKKKLETVGPFLIGRGRF